MWRLLWLLLYLAMVPTLGGALAPWVWWALQMGAEWHRASWLQQLAEHPFHRVVHRCLLFVAVAGLWPLSKALGGWSWRELGLATGHAGRDAGKGALVGLGMFAFVVGVELGTGARGIRHGALAPEMAGLVGRAMLSALAVAAIEEVLFRGFLCQALRRTAGWGVALVLSSTVYAMVHFIRSPATQDPVAWNSGWRALGGMAAGWTNPGALMPAWGTLYLAGTLLALALRHYGTIYFGMGLHAGWVFWIKLRGALTAASLPPVALGTRGMVPEGWLSLWVLAASTALLAWRWSAPEEGRLAEAGQTPRDSDSLRQGEFEG